MAPIVPSSASSSVVMSSCGGRGRGGMMMVGVVHGAVVHAAEDLEVFRLFFYFFFSVSAPKHET